MTAGHRKETCCPESLLKRFMLGVLGNGLLLLLVHVGHHHFTKDNSAVSFQDDTAVQRVAGDGPAWPYQSKVHASRIKRIVLASSAPRASSTPTTCQGDHCEHLADHGSTGQIYEDSEAE
jgi:hypothetical protein